MTDFPDLPGSKAHTLLMITYLTAHAHGQTVQRQYVDTKRWRDVGAREIAGMQSYDHFRIKPELTADEIASEAYWEERQKLASEIYRVVEQVQQGCGKSHCRFSIDGSNNPKAPCGCLGLPSDLKALADRVHAMNGRIDTVVLPRNGTYPDSAVEQKT
jgi:hypothetical protein